MNELRELLKESNYREQGLKLRIIELEDEMK